MKKANVVLTDKARTETYFMEAFLTEDPQHRAILLGRARRADAKRFQEFCDMMAKALESIADGEWTLTPRRVPTGKGRGL